MASKSFLPDGTMETLICALCENYLSIPPITIVSEDGELLRCGRCHEIKTKVNIRVTKFENILKFAQFPCIYDNCKEKLSWGEVEEHERVCPHKSVPCFFFDCSDDIMVNDLEIHFTTKKHITYGDQVIYEKFEDYIKFDQGYVSLLVKNNAHFLIYWHIVENNKWISVFSLESNLKKNITYEVKLSAEKSKISVLHENQTIIPYNPREHCRRCLFDDEECVLPHHKYSVLYNEGTTKTDSFRTTKIDEHDIKRLLSFGRIICTINIVDGVEIPKVNNQEFLVEEHSWHNNKLFRQILQCPICIEFMPTRIYTCKTGHKICNICKPLVKTCPTCRTEIGKSRNYELEYLAEKIKLDCQHREKGCNFVGNVKMICRHEAVCAFTNG